MIYTFALISIWGCGWMLLRIKFGVPACVSIPMSGIGGLVIGFIGGKLSYRY